MNGVSCYRYLHYYSHTCRNIRQDAQQNVPFLFLLKAKNLQPQNNPVGNEDEYHCLYNASQDVKHWALKLQSGILYGVQGNSELIDTISTTYGRGYGRATAKLQVLS